MNNRALTFDLFVLLFVFGDEELRDWWPDDVESVLVNLRGQPILKLLILGASLKLLTAWNV